MSVKIRKFLILNIMLVSFVGLSAATATEWELADTDEGIKSFRKDEPGNPITAFKGEAVVDAPLAKVAWVIRDNDHRTEWVDRLQLSRVLETHSQFDKVLYQHFGLPWPISDRDYVYRAKALWRGDVLHFELQSTTSQNAPETVGVRARLIRCVYRLKAWGADRTHVTVEVHTDPMGSLPATLVNFIQKSWPIKTLRGIRRMVKKPYAQMAELPPRP